MFFFSDMRLFTKSTKWFPTYILFVSEFKVNEWGLNHISKLLAYKDALGIPRDINSPNRNSYWIQYEICCIRSGTADKRTWTLTSFCFMLIKYKLSVLQLDHFGTGEAKQTVSLDQVLALNIFPFRYFTFFLSKLFRSRTHTTVGVNWFLIIC